MSEHKKNIDRVLNEMTEYPARDILYEFNQAYQRYSNSIHIFDDGTKMSAVEAHTLKHICQNKGITITDMANYWGRTKGTVSSQITNLEKKGYVYREKCKNNPKKTHIFPTESGTKVNHRHSRYDINETRQFMAKWLEKYTMEDMHRLTEYLEFYIKTAYNKDK